jgi:hypothetical protein
MDGTPLEDVKLRDGDSEEVTRIVPAAPAPAPAPAPAAKPVSRPPVAAKPAAAKPAAAKPAAAPKTKKGEFSETKWFMAGDMVKEDEIGPEAYPVDQLEPRYRKTHELPADVRHKFSLTKEGEDAPKKN